MEKAMTWGIEETPMVTWLVTGSEKSAICYLVDNSMPKVQQGNTVNNSHQEPSVYQTKTLPGSKESRGGLLLWCN
jgi:hypothetical protein